MSEQNLTAGASRALQEARISEEANSFQRFFRMLTGFLESEGRATEILRAANVELNAALEVRDSESSIPYAEWRRTVLRRADQIAAQTAGNAPTGTEHLLAAALDLDPAVTQLLGPFGVTFDGLLPLITIHEPELEVAEQIEIQISSAEPGSLDQASLYRILDASANRAREGLRAVEDYVRFRLDDGIISAELKAIRHQLNETLNHLGQTRWTSSRDTLHDVGTVSALASERQRGSLVDVLRANLKRTEEALRSLEEYSKLLDSQLSLQLSDCRYRLYTVEKSLENSIQNRHRLESCQLYLLVTAASCRYGAEQTIRHSLEKGVDIVQIREKEMSTRELIAYGKNVRKWTDEVGKLLILNDRVDVAAAIGADGVHLGQDDLDVTTARQLLGGASLIGVSTHSPEQARKAIFDGADYLGVGPTFPSNTKAFNDFPGLDYVEYVARNVCVPWFAIGGIDAGNLGEVMVAGGRRIAVSSIVCNSPHPRGIVAQLKEKLQRPPVRILDADLGFVRED